MIELAALEVFGERGYHGASIDEICRRSGVTPPVLYDHFASKQELYERLLERHYAELREIWFRHAADGDRHAYEGDRHTADGRLRQPLLRLRARARLRLGPSSGRSAGQGRPFMGVAVQRQRQRERRARAVAQLQVSAVRSRDGA